MFRNLYIRVTHYTLRHYDSWDTECLRNWYLEGSNDLKKFKIIKEHRKDKSLFGKGSTHTWSVDTKSKRYRAFRIRQFGHNSNKHWYLALSGVEFVTGNIWRNVFQTKMIMTTPVSCLLLIIGFDI